MARNRFAINAISTISSFLLITIPLPSTLPIKALNTTTIKPVLSINLAPRVEIDPKDTLTATQRAWLDKLELCESSGNPGAVNPRDRDNTRSFGLLQFKPATFAYYKKLYGITGTLMDPEAQETIVAKMIERSDTIDWHKQFPDCTKRLGPPPVNKI